MMPPDKDADAFGAHDPTACAVCGLESCEDPTHRPTDTTSRPLIAFTAAQLQHHVFPERQAIFWRGDAVLLRAGHVAQVHAERGMGKSLLLASLAVAAATGRGVLGFTAPEPLRVLLVDGEMDSREIQQRTTLLCDLLEVDLPESLTFIAADWQEDFLPRIDTPIGQALLERFVEPADLVIFDNRSCLTDPENEKDPAAWQATLQLCLSLRRRGKAVIFAHHGNRLGGARGHSRPEDILNLSIKLARPTDYTQDQGARFEVHFDKARGIHGSGVAPFLAHLTADGWQVQSLEVQTEKGTEAKLLQYLRLADRAGERPTSANTAITRAGVQRNAGLAAWAALKDRGAIHIDAQGAYFVP